MQEKRYNSRIEETPNQENKRDNTQNVQPLTVLSPAGANATNMKLNDRKPAQLWVVCLSPSARGFPQV